MKSVNECVLLADYRSNVLSAKIKSKISQAYIAKKLKVTQGHVSLMEAGKVPFKEWELASWLEVYGVPKAQFLRMINNARSQSKEFWEPLPLLTRKPDAPNEVVKLEAVALEWMRELEA